MTPVSRILFLGCAVPLALAAVSQDEDVVEEAVPPCEWCESELLQDHSWKPHKNHSLYKEAAKAGGLSDEDAERLKLAIEKAGGQKASLMLTVTDGGMLDMAQNMVRSLDAVPCKAPKLVIGLGSNLCHKFKNFDGTTCVEVFKDGPSSEDEVAWGSHEYWQVVFRKHAVLTLVATSMATRHVVYSDPDIVFLDCPVGFMLRKYQDTHDIVFSSNNMLEPQAASIDDLAETYETRGMAHILLGPHKRRADINTGLFYMQSSKPVVDLMMETMRIFKDQEHVHGHYQQFSLVQALEKLPDLRIGVAGGDRLVNGNVFWGHRELLQPGRVISVHANWMKSKMKIPCLKGAKLWVKANYPRRLTAESWERLPKASMDARFATVESCDASAGPAAAGGQSSGDQASSRPPAPTKPGCYLWLPTGCQKHTFNAQLSWRLMGQLEERKKCENGAKKMYREWCGNQDAETLFVEGTAKTLPADAPAMPSGSGCFVWMPEGCDKRNFHAQKAWRQASSSDYPDQDSCEVNAPSKFNTWCETDTARVLWVPKAPEAPTEPGCYAFLPTGCKDHDLKSSEGWIRDTWGEDNDGARTDKLACEQGRRDSIDLWCGISNTQMVFVK